MIDYKTTFVNTDGAVFPNTKAKNASSPSATDGTEFVKAMIDDEWGARQALMDEVGLTPDGVQEAPGTSQFVQALKTLAMESGTAMLFAQSSAPIGWTQDVSKNDYMLRVVSGVGGGFGGTDSPILMDKVPAHTHPGSSNTAGSHRHTITSADGQGTPTTQVVWSAANSNGTAYSNYAGDHSHTVTVAANTGAANWAPKYVDIIICTKDAV